MNSESENQSQNSNTRHRHNRFRDGIVWGVAASLTLFFMNPLLVFPTALILAGFAGYRGRSYRPVIGTILTVFLIAGVGFLIFYHSISKINH